MLDKKALIYLAIITALIIGLMYFLFGMGTGYDWRVHYDRKSKDPYGTFLVKNLLAKYYPEKGLQEIRGDLAGELNDSSGAGNYVFLGQAFFLDSVQSNALLRFAAGGNSVFIASPVLQPSLLDSIFAFNCNSFFSSAESYGEAAAEFDQHTPYTDTLVMPSDTVLYTQEIYSDENRWPYLEDSTVVLNLTHPGLQEQNGYKFIFNQRYGPEMYIWEYLPLDLPCREHPPFSILGTMNDSLRNFIRIRYGEGSFYWHTNPIAFTNFFLKEESGLEYAGKVFSHLPPGTIYWDATNRGVSASRRDRQGGNSFGESPLKYILSQPPLAWAWYILLSMALLYLLFRAKRRQRIIPVLEKNQNTSLEFINTIGRLYFAQSNHRQLALQKMKLFLGFVRDRYHISTREWDEDFRKLLSAKSEIPENVINKIFTIHGNILRSRFSSENTLIEFHRALEYFYMNCK